MFLSLIFEVLLVAVQAATTYTNSYNTSSNYERIDYYNNIYSKRLDHLWMNRVITLTSAWQKSGLNTIPSPSCEPIAVIVNTDYTRH